MQSASDQPAPSGAAGHAPLPLTRLSRAVARIEAPVAGLLTLAVFVVLMLNVVSRSLGKPLIWSDELAIHLMIWAALFGASLGLAYQQHIAVTLVPDLLGPRNVARLALAVDVVLLVFFVVLAVLLWQWFDLPGLYAAGSAAAHGPVNFNFIWSEPTVTLGVRKVWFWLILPIFCLTGGLHVLASVIERAAALLRGELTTETAQ